MPGVEDQVELLLVVSPEDVDAWASGPDLPDERVARHPASSRSSCTRRGPRRRRGRRPLQQHAALRDRGLCRRWGLTGDDIYLTVVEFGFVGGLVFGYLPVLLNGATGVLLSRWNAEEALRLIEEHGCTYVLAMPTHGNDMINAAEATDRDLSSMRILAGPGLTPERRVRMKAAFGVPPLGDYGLSEVPGHAAHAPDDPEEDPAYGGPALRRDRDPHRRRGHRAAGPRGDDRRGHRQRAEPLPRLLQERRPDARVADGVGRLSHRRPRHARHRGHFIYVGRSKDIIRRGGVTIVPAEIEPVIGRHPAVRGGARPASGRATEARLRSAHPAPGLQAPGGEDLQAFLDAEGVAEYTWPESVEVFQQFPRTPSLKVVKRDVVKEIIERRQVTA